MYNEMELGPTVGNNKPLWLKRKFLKAQRHNTQDNGDLKKLLLRTNHYEVGMLCVFLQILQVQNSLPSF